MCPTSGSASGSSPSRRLQPGASADEAVIIEAAAEHVGRYKLPKRVIIVDRVQRAPNGKADYPWARESREVDGCGARVTFAQTLPPPRSIDELDAADRDLDDVGVAVVTGVLDPVATADVRARLLDAADRSDAVGIPTRGYAFDFDEKNRRVFMLFVWDAIFVELIRHPLALRYVNRTIGDFLISNFSANVTGPGAGGMYLHADQYYVPQPWTAPFAVNVAWLLDDFTDENGATRVVAGSHRSLPDFAALPSRPSPSKDQRAASWSWTVGCGTRPARTEPSQCTALRSSGTTSSPGSVRRSTGTRRCRLT